MNIEKEKILDYLFDTFENKVFIRTIFSDSLDKNFKKIVFKLIQMNEEVNLQIESFIENKTFHKNISLNNKVEIKDYFLDKIEYFKQITLFSETKTYIFSKKNSKFSLKIKNNDLKADILNHNRKKIIF